MATRKTRIDVTASAIITEAGAFPPEATIPNKDEQRIAVYPMRIYEGYNYLPTYYGYKSYFGLDSTLEATGLPADVVVEDIFVYQTRSFKNVIVALTDRGIYMREGTAWVHILVLDTPATNTSRFWTKTVINQIFFLYYQGGDAVYVIEELIDGAGINMDVFNGMKVQPERVDTESLTLQVFSFVPTLLNMEGQVGIYKAGGSLGFWDSDDSIAWSAVADYTDFEPSLTTLANTIKLQDQVGKITQICEHGDGFIVYCTRSIVYVLEDNDALLRFRSTVVLGNVGVAYPREITVAQPDTTHYAWTSMGLVQIMDGEAEPIVPDFSDHVKRTKTPQYLDMLNNRYLCVGVMDPNFIPGNVDFSTVTVDPADITFPGVTIPGVLIEGTTIPGDEVCLPNNEYDYEPDWDDPLVDPDPNDPTIPDYPKQEVLDSGIKPYHVLQFYRQWKYNGANIFPRELDLPDGSKLKCFYLTEGSTDAAYQDVPLKMRADEVADFNFTDQTTKLFERQMDQYLSHYADTGGRFQTAWDEYQELQSESNLKALREELVSVDLSYFAYKGLGRVWPGFAKGSDFEGSSTYTAGFFVIDTEGRVYVGPHRNNFPVVGFDLPIKASAVTAALEEYANYFPSLYSPSQTIRHPEWYVYIGTVEEYDYAVLPAPYQTTLSLGVFSQMPKGSGFPPEDDSSDEESKYFILNPEAFKGIVPIGAQGGKAAYKLSYPGSLGVKVQVKSLDEPFRLLKCFPSVIVGQNGEYAADFTLPPEDVQDALAQSMYRESLGDYDAIIGAKYECLVVDRVGLQETDNPDELRDLLFGRIPTNLPPTAVGATAIRQMEEEDKRGLIAVHQHFYSQNRRRDRLDSSFLIKAAGRVDVPLGTPLGSPIADAYPSRFTEKAEWANRWYELRYEPILPEGGWPEGEFWPPESTDPNWDPTTPFPPVDDRGWEVVQQAAVCGVTEPITTPDIYIPPVTYAPWTVENPPLTWVLQNGSVAPYNPTMFGAYVYDLHLQKWGVFKGNHKHLVDYQPINNYSPGSVDYKNFLIEGGCLAEDLSVALFNDYPTDNYIKYGKYQHVSSEVCAIEEVHLTFRGESTGLVAVQFSLDGRSPEYGHSIAEWFNQALSHTLNCDIVGKWATITVTGHYDLSGMTVKSHPTGRR